MLKLIAKIEKAERRGKQKTQVFGFGYAAPGDSPLVEAYPRCARFPGNPK